MSETPSYDKAPIRGWLILLGIITWAAPFLDGLVLIIVISTRLSKSPLLLVTVWIATAFTILLLVLFVQRRRSFVTWEYVYLTYGVMVEVVMMVFYQASKLGI